MAITQYINCTSGSYSSIARHFEVWISIWKWKSLESCSDYRSLLWIVHPTGLLYKQTLPMVLFPSMNFNHLGWIISQIHNKWILSSIGYSIWFNCFSFARSKIWKLTRSTGFLCAILANRIACTTMVWNLFFTLLLKQKNIMLGGVEWATI